MASVKALSPVSSPKTKDPTASSARTVPAAVRSSNTRPVGTWAWLFILSILTMVFGPLSTTGTQPELSARGLQSTGCQMAQATGSQDPVPESTRTTAWLQTGPVHCPFLQTGGPARALPMGRPLAGKRPTLGPLPTLKTSPVLLGSNLLSFQTSFRRPPKRSEPSPHPPAGYCAASSREQ